MTQGCRKQGRAEDLKYPTAAVQTPKKIQYNIFTFNLAGPQIAQTALARTAFHADLQLCMSRPDCCFHVLLSRESRCLQSKLLFSLLPQAECNLKCMTAFCFVQAVVHAADVIGMLNVVPRLHYHLHLHSSAVLWLPHTSFPKLCTCNKQCAHMSQ